MPLKLGDFELNRIYQGDSIELMRRIPDNSVDLIFADPPYNLQLNGELYRPNQTKVDAVNDDWDKFNSFEEYDNFSFLWLKECKRILKDTGSLWVIGTYHNIFRLGTIIQNLDLWILNDIIWIKTNPMPNFKGTRFNNAHETLIWATKSKNSNYTFHYHSLKIFNDDLQMRSDWYIPICQGEERVKINGKKAHSTQKPEELLYRIILSTSNPGDIIFDPFSGSGTTAAVAKKLGRKFLAFEKDENYVKISIERLEKIQTLTQDLLEYKVEKRIPRIPFGLLIEKGIIRVGEFLFSKDLKHKAKVLADGSIQCENVVGSIHKISAYLLGKERNNGWEYWFVKRDDKLLSINRLRFEYYKTNYDVRFFFIEDLKKENNSLNE
ncbi:MAG: DNA methyltransferase [Ignavibacteria bacterium]|nr:DNA methyltransferase [Ignavibacteria bacterium]